MKWDDAAEVIKEAWEEELDADDGSYYKEHINKVLDMLGIYHWFLTSGQSPLSSFGSWYIPEHAQEPPQCGK